MGSLSNYIIFGWIRQWFNLMLAICWSNYFGENIFFKDFDKFEWGDYLFHNISGLQQFQQQFYWFVVTFNNLYYFRLSHVSARERRGCQYIILLPYWQSYHILPVFGQIASMLSYQHTGNSTKCKDYQYVILLTCWQSYRYIASIRCDGCAWSPNSHFRHAWSLYDRGAFAFNSKYPTI